MTMQPLIYSLMIIALSLPALGNQQGRNELEAEFQASLYQQNPIMRCLNAVRESLTSRYGEKAANEMIEAVGAQADLSMEARCHEIPREHLKMLCLEKAYRSQIRFLINELDLRHLRHGPACRGF